MSADAAQLSLNLSARDAQFLAVAIILCSSTLNPEAIEDVRHNGLMLYELFRNHYSAPELNTLVANLRALVSEDSPLNFVDLPLTASTNTLVS